MIMKKSIVKYILIFAVAAAAFLCGWALIDMLIHPGTQFADGFKKVFDWILAVIFGISCAFSSWKKDNQGNDKNNKEGQ
jgi:hypothetical protein